MTVVGVVNGDDTADGVKGIRRAGTLESVNVIPQRLLVELSGDGYRVSTAFVVKAVGSRRVVVIESVGLEVIFWQFGIGVTAVNPRRFNDALMDKARGEIAPQFTR